ncbi:MAG: hypothetical protein GTO22_20715 [Gemmatimonadales bacterium]|nr:hypothetical protein [Gemmatimonadales bacterium]
MKERFALIALVVAAVASVVAAYTGVAVYNASLDVQVMGVSHYTSDAEFGTDGSGVDLTFYSDTSGDYGMWDTSAEALIIIGTDGQDALDVNDGNVDIADDIDVDGTANLDDADIDLSAEFEVDGHLTDFGGCTANVADGDNDVCVAAVLEVDGELELDGTLDANSTADIAGNITSASGALTVTDNVLIDGQADAIQLTVQGHTTQTTNANLFVVEDSGGTDILAVAVPPAAGASGDLIDLTDTFGAMNGSDTVIGIDINLTGANHTGTGNALHGIDIDLTTADADASEIAIELSDTDWDTGIKGAVNLEHIGFPTIASASVVTTANDGGLFTIADGEIWFVHAMWVNVTTNFDCTGNDCTLILGDGLDTDGFCTLADAELQTSDTVATGFAAGWQCMEAGTRGVYLDEATTNAFTGGFVYAPSGASETIDVDVGGTDVAAGAATIYVLYTRIQ